MWIKEAGGARRPRARPLPLPACVVRKFGRAMLLRHVVRILWEGNIATAPWRSEAPAFMAYGMSIIQCQRWRGISQLSTLTLLRQVFAQVRHVPVAAHHRILWGRKAQTWSADMMR